jgi:hypothetical protein
LQNSLILLENRIFSQQTYASEEWQTMRKITHGVDFLQGENKKRMDNVRVERPKLNAALFEDF